MVPKMVPGGAQNRAPALPGRPPDHRDLPGIPRDLILAAPGLPWIPFWQPRRSPGHHFEALLSYSGPSPSEFFVEFQEQLAVTLRRVFNNFWEQLAATTTTTTRTTTTTTATTTTTIPQQQQPQQQQQTANNNNNNNSNNKNNSTSNNNSNNNNNYYYYYYCYYYQ